MLGKSVFFELPNPEKVREIKILRDRAIKSTSEKKNQFIISSLDQGNMENPNTNLLAWFTAIPVQLFNKITIL